MKIKPILTLTIILLFCCTSLFAQGEQEVTKTVINNGVGLGAVIAVVASWSRNQSILWAILHAILSWLYVIYFALTRSANA